MDGQGSSPNRDKIFLFSIASRPALGPTQPPIQWVPGTLSQGVKRLGREADHSPPAIAEVKKAGAIPLLPHTSSWLGAQLTKPKDEFTLPFKWSKMRLVERVASVR
jgi:hypothetical protein